MTSGGRGFCAAALVAALAACGGDAAFFEDEREPLEVRLASMSLAEPGLFEQKALLSLRVLNPNAVDAPLDGVSVALRLGDRDVGRGVGSLDTVVPALGDVLIDAPVITRTTDLLAMVAAGADAVPTDYAIDGALIIGGARQSFADSGALPGGAWLGGGAGEDGLVPAPLTEP